MGKVTAENMNSLGIFKGKDLKAQSLEFLARNFGKSGRHFYEIVRGIQHNEVKPNRIRKSIAAERTYITDLASTAEMMEKLTLIAEELERRMQRSQVKGKTITVKIKHHDFSIQSRSRTQEEWLCTKEEIMTMYFNKFDFLNLAVGVKSAANVYFNTTPDSLKIEQAAMLVGMAKNPSYFNPLRRPELTLNRRNVVLSQMVRYDYLSKMEFDSLKNLPLGIDFQKVDHKRGMAPYFREYLRTSLTANEPSRDRYPSYADQQFVKDSIEWETNPFYGWCNKNVKADGTPYNIYKDGLKIYTTLDSRMQRYAEEAVVEHLGLDLQKAFNREKENHKYPPFSDDLSKEDVDQNIETSMRRSERYRVLKKNGMMENPISLGSLYSL